MDEISSTEFRKRYASLRAPTLVTVNGHRIGAWIPVTDEVELRVDAPPKAYTDAVARGQAGRDELLGKINRSR